MFALVIERDPLTYQDVPAMLVTWVQVVGGFAAFLIALWIFLIVTRVLPFDWRRVDPKHSLFFRTCVVGCALCYAALAVTSLSGLIGSTKEVSMAQGSTGPSGTDGSSPPSRMATIQSALLTAGGLFALAAVSMAFLVNLPQQRLRRIWAITRLSFKEALRRRVPYAFAILLAVFLFGNWYVPFKPEDQVRTYVSLVYYAMGPLLLVSALVLGAFSIPTDIRQQTIHTVVTKPVERFEIVLGRFLGFVGLLTIILLVMTTLSLIYVLRNVDPAAAAESLMARVPAYGELTFENTTDKTNKKGISVGREWEYRSYIGMAGPGRRPPTALWSYAPLPAAVAQRPFVRSEFTFDVFRLDKGFENKNLPCTFYFQTWNFKKGSEEEYRRRRGEEEKTRKAENEKKARADRKTGAQIELEVADQLGEEFGYFEKIGKPIVDYHTESIDIPGGFFRNALKGPPPQSAGTEPVKPDSAILIRVKSDSSSGQIGMARYDFYFRLDNPEGGWETFWFAWNFYKGAVGLWFSTVLVCGLAISFSTHLTGVIALLITLMLFVGGMFHEFIQSVGEAKNFGGGPVEALYRIGSRMTLAAPLDDTTVTRVATGSDEAFRWVVRRFLNILPDVDRYSFSSYVADGFDIPSSQLWLNLLMLAGYLLPCAVLAFYLIKGREIAADT